jgi:hypothetical protein
MLLTIRVFYKDYVISPDGNSEPKWGSFLPSFTYELRMIPRCALRQELWWMLIREAKSSSAKLKFASQESYGIALDMVKEDLCRA